jgi:hypothetical protein
MSKVTMIEKHPSLKRGPITVRPYFDAGQSNMGLEKYNIAIHDGVFHEEQIGCLEKNGTLRYLTGLNEFAPEVKLIENKEEREAKIKEIRTLVSQLEKELAANVIEITDADFWNKVKLLKPDNIEFWGKITLRVGNTPLTLDPVKDPYDLIKLKAIEAGGFSIVAKSFDEARALPTPPKFYLDKYEESVASKNAPKKLKNKAIAELQGLFDKNQNKLFYICKVVDAQSIVYKKSTPNDVLYENMDKFINGEGYEKNLGRAAQSFLDACNQDMETLKIRSIIKDATYLKYIALKGDGFLWHMETNSMMGKNASELIEFLKNPLNESVLDSLMSKVESQWN